MYARSGITEFWLVDVIAGRIQAYREPASDGYASSHIVQRGDVISPLAFPDIEVAVDFVLPKP